MLSAMQPISLIQFLYLSILLIQLHVHFLYYFIFFQVSKMRPRVNSFFDKNSKNSLIICFFFNFTDTLPFLVIQEKAVHVPYLCHAHPKLQFGNQLRSKNIHSLTFFCIFYFKIHAKKQKEKGMNANKILQIILQTKGRK